MRVRVSVNRHSALSFAVVHIARLWVWFWFWLGLGLGLQLRLWQMSGSCKDGCAGVRVRTEGVPECTQQSQYPRLAVTHLDSISSQKRRSVAVLPVC